MLTTFLPALVAGLLAAGDAPKDDAAKAEMAKMAGTWTFESVTVDGREVPAEQLKAIQIVQQADGKFTILANGQPVAAGESVLNPGSTPKSFDRTYSDGPDKGRKAYGIYELNGDTLKICLARDDPKKRPMEFSSKPGSGQTLSVVKRVKP
jgi:uncharacterized protein (TIGR03067 family)